ncbi:helix-hairpin-helix domain-containing protein [Aquimarina sp. MMG016]|uniref:ComEA family DNA-binding protein n=1 Tax=Aquimarina sp. MMG016 TaxID=2822690 RepID=UPI001B3A1707|nr:helix-hairpin-helix domain-containing protein [Aquimarina sp. MMG016]MBQ4822167.1 helix-hairpin-helix domain-containing protein [Aquimarina sp. MMG016]
MHSRFRNGILLLSILLFVLVLCYTFFPYYTNKQNNFKELTAFQKQVDSLKEIEQKERVQYKQRPFNPNFISDYRGYSLGLTPEQLDKIYQYRKQGKWINSTADFKNVTGVSDSLLAIISPMFKFPEWLNNNNKPREYKSNKFPIKSFKQKGNLNVVTVQELQEDLGIPDFIADKIIKHRNKFKGYVDDIQLKDVSGLYEYHYNKILSSYTVKTPSKINRINLNNASVKELMEIPYFDFETALEVKDFVEANNGISNFEELGKIEGFSLEKIDRLALYLTLK